MLGQNGGHSFIIQLILELGALVRQATTCLSTSVENCSIYDTTHDDTLDLSTHSTFSLRERESGDCSLEEVISSHNILSTHPNGTT